MSSWKRLVNVAPPEPSSATGFVEEVVLSNSLRIMISLIDISSFKSCRSSESDTFEDWSDLDCESTMSESDT